MAQTIKPLHAVYNFKYNYIRVYGGFFNSETLHNNFKDKTTLFEYLSKYKKYQTKFGLKLKFDCAEEADDLYGNLKTLGSEQILEWIREYQILVELPSDSIVFLTNDLRAKENTPDEFKDMVEIYCKYHYFNAPCIDSHMLDNRDIKKKFYIPLSRQSVARRWMYEFIKSNKSIQNNSYWSWNKRDGDGYLLDAHRDDEVYAMERYYESGREHMDTYHFAGHLLQTHSFCNVIMETYFENDGISEFTNKMEIRNERFFTEKTYRPLSMCQPFIFGGNSNMLHYLHNWGFKTFSDYWDESYDLIDNDEDRMAEIQNLILKLNEKSLEEIQSMYLDMIPILQHNYNNLKKLDRFSEFQNSMNFNVTEGYEFSMDRYDLEINNKIVKTI